MFATSDEGIAAVECKSDPLATTLALARHCDCSEGCSLNFNLEFLDRRNKEMAAVRLPPQNRREEPDEGGSTDWSALMVPGSVAGNAHVRMAAHVGGPLIDGRQAPFVNEILKLGQAQSLEFNWRAALGHASFVLDCFEASLKAGVQEMSDRSAIITGAGKRVGAFVARELLADGWTVVAHVHNAGDEVPRGAVKVVADLADPVCAEVIFAQAEGLPPVQLLVNNAARFSWDGFGEFSATEFDAHMAVNVRAPALLIEHFSRIHQSGDASIINLLDSKLSAPNPDYLSYTLSKYALAALTELAARALAPRSIRVNGIAPGLMLRSTGQTEENYQAMHANNPLRRGVEPDDVMEALRYLLSAKTVTGEVIKVDAGHHFMALRRDVQFLGLA